MIAPKYEIGDLIKIKEKLLTAPNQQTYALVLGYRVAIESIFPNPVYKLLYLDKHNTIMERTQEWVDEEYEYA
jgi:hypothetical protein